MTVLWRPQKTKYTFLRCAILLKWEFRKQLFSKLAWGRGLSAESDIFMCMVSGSGGAPGACCAWASLGLRADVFPQARLGVWSRPARVSAWPVSRRTWQRACACSSIAQCFWARRRACSADLFHSRFLDAVSSHLVNRQHR